MSDAIQALQAALAHQQNGEHEAALTLLGVLLQRAPDHPDAHHLMGLSLHALGRSGDALQEVERAIAVRPDVAMFHTNAGVMALAAGDPEGAIARHTRAIEIDPMSSDAFNNLGIALQHQCLFEDAQMVLEKAALLNPNSASSRVNLGNVLRSLGRVTDAVEAYEEAIALSPDLAEAHNNLGNALKQLGRYGDAVASFDRALALMPDYADACYNRSLVLALRGDTEGALAGLDGALALRDDDRFHMARAGLLPVIGRSAEHLQYWRDRFVAEIGDLIARDVRLPITAIDAPIMNFYLAYHGENDREIMTLLSRFYRQACPELCWTAPHCEAGAAMRGGGRLRVGFFSMYFKDHAVCWTVRDLLAALPADRFERSVITTVTPAEIDDALVATADRTEHVPQDLLTVRRRIAEMELDILVYADIGMDALSYCLAHGRLAPVQCATWGHPVTTGIPTVDYYLSSDVAEPPDAASHYTETLIRLDGVQTSYRFPRMPEHVRGRAALGLPAEGTLYICPQSLFKVHPSMDAPLAAILRGDPDARLVVFWGVDEFAVDALSNRWRRAFGEMFDRVCILPRMRFDGFMQVLCSADVLLDSFPFGGGNTSYQGFAAGVPIVTLSGDYLRGRGGLAHYRLMEIEGCVASSAEEYVEIALRLGTNKAYRAGIAALIRDRRDVLFDDRRVVEHLAQILQDIAR